MNNPSSSKEIIDMLIKTEGIKSIDLSDLGLVDQEIIDLLPDDIALRHKVVSFAQDEKNVFLATPNPFDIHTRDAVSELMHAEPVFCFSNEAQVDAYLRKYYLHDDVFLDEMDDAGDSEQDGRDEHSIETLKSRAEEGPAIRHVNNILLNAIQVRASDIYIEPHETKLKI
ncbi:MAG: hypothetical protein DWQ10_13960, partial [Calditrichaeota bacterium]